MDLVAACWLTMAATPEGAQGQVTFQVADFWPQPASRAAHMAASSAMLRILLFIISLLFCFASDEVQVIFQHLYIENVA